MKCRNKGARSDADLFGLFWLGGLLDIMMRGGCGRGERISYTTRMTTHEVEIHFSRLFEFFKGLRLAKSILFLWALVYPPTE